MYSLPQREAVVGLVVQEFEMDIKLNITEKVEKVTDIISYNIFDMRQLYEEGDILVGLLMSTIMLQHRLKLPFEVVQEMMLNLRISVDEAAGMEKSEEQIKEEQLKEEGAI